MIQAPPLVGYGIQTEDSDVRAHVSVVNRAIYVFPTRNGLEAIQRSRLSLRFASQRGVSGHTAAGVAMPIAVIADLRKLRFHSWPRWSEFSLELSTSEKGALAVACVLDAMQLGRFPFWIDASEDERRDVQLKGTDILVFCNKRVQVKCDYRSGDAPHGTGNLFLQTAERNPLGLH